MSTDSGEATPPPLPDALITPTTRGITEADGLRDDIGERQDLRPKALVRWLGTPHRFLLHSASRIGSGDGASRARTGSSRSPLVKFDRIRRGGPASSNPATRRASPASTTRISSRAR